MTEPIRLKTLTNIFYNAGREAVETLLFTPVLGFLTTSTFVAQQGMQMSWALE